MSKTSATEISTSTRSKSFSTPAHSPQLVTPISTPPVPSFAEQRLQQMLRNCEAGTHSFHRDDEDDYVPGGPSGAMAGQVSDMRRKSFAGGEGKSHSDIDPVVGAPELTNSGRPRTTKRSTSIFPFVIELESTIWRIHPISA